MLPIPPVGRAHLYFYTCLGIDPTVIYSTARENKRMDSVIINDSQFEITLKWGCRNRLPFHEPLLQIIEASPLIWIINGYQ
jgi:hypothetical protein